MIDINNLSNGMIINSGELNVLVKSAEKKTTKSDKPFIIGQFSTKDGEIQFKIWDDKLKTLNMENFDEIIAERTKLGTPMILSIEGKVEDFNGLYINVSNFSEIDGNISDYICPEITEEQYENLVAKLRDYIKQIKNIEYKNLVNIIFADVIFKERFFNSAAAYKNHHNYFHGLLKHTVEVLDYAIALYDANPREDIDRDLIIVGALLHDIGKTEEYISSEFSTLYNDFSLGHLVSGVSIIMHILGKNISKTNTIENGYCLSIKDKEISISNSTLNKVFKIINLHHGPYEGDKMSKSFNQAVKDLGIPEIVYIFAADMVSSQTI